MRIGSDMVSKQEDRLIIYAARPMDIPVREFCRVPVHFQGQTYYVRSKRKGERPYAMIYELWPWPGDLHAASDREVNYSEACVIERDRIAASECSHERIHLVLLPFYPLLGLCWSRVKNEVLIHFGFNPGSITKASIALVFNLFLVDAIFVEWLGGGILGSGVLDWLFLVLLGLDSLIRFSQSLKSDEEPLWGFCEWLRPGRKSN